MDYRDDSSIVQEKLADLAREAEAARVRVAALTPPVPQLWPTDRGTASPKHLLLGVALWIAGAVAALVLGLGGRTGSVWTYGGWIAAGLALLAARYAGNDRAVLGPLALASSAPLLVLRPVLGDRSVFAEGAQHYLAPAVMFALTGVLTAALLLLPTRRAPRRPSPGSEARAAEVNDLRGRVEDLAENVSGRSPRPLRDALHTARMAVVQLHMAVQAVDAAPHPPPGARLHRALAIGGVAPVALLVYAHRNAWANATETDRALVPIASCVCLAYVLVAAARTWSRRLGRGR